MLPVLRRCMRAKCWLHRLIQLLFGGCGCAAFKGGFKVRVSEEVGVLGVASALSTQLIASCGTLEWDTCVNSFVWFYP